MQNPMKTRACILAAALLLVACGEEAAEGAEGPTPSEGSADEGSAAEGSAALGEGGEADPGEPEEPPGPVAEDPTYELRATASGPYASGEEAQFQIELTPRGEYHVNQDFPMEIALRGPEGVTLPGAALGNGDAAEFNEERARFEVPFTAASAGEHTVTAEVDFAVCTPEACFPERRTLALALPVN